MRARVGYWRCARSNVVGYVCDVTDQDAVDKVIDEVLSEFEGKIDVLVNCAGEGTPFEPKVTSTVEDFKADFDSHMSANVQSFICPVKAVLEKAMVKAQDGQVISLSCALGRDSVGIHSHAVRRPAGDTLLPCKIGSSLRRHPKLRRPHWHMLCRAKYATLTGYIRLCFCCC